MERSAGNTWLYLWILSALGSGILCKYKGSIYFLRTDCVSFQFTIYGIRIFFVDFFKIKKYIKFINMSCKSLTYLIVHLNSVYYLNLT